MNIFALSHQTKVQFSPQAAGNLPKEINGIAALRRLLKEFKINTIKSDFFVLAKLRNKAAHMGISPTVVECNKYIEDCEELLKYHRIKFYEIEK